MRKDMKRLAGVVVVFVALGLLLAAYLSIAGLMARPKAADVAIVFGNTVERTGEPSPRLKARLDRAWELYASRQARLIIVSGGLGKEGFDESAVMKQYLVRSGVPEAAVHADGQGINTTRTCANAHAFMTAQGLHGANVVTQYFHVERAKLACRRVGIKVVGAAAPRYYELRDVYSLAREVIAFPVYALRGR
jgi:vancomycin permeability regulator SanA